jgi:peptide/nickel transport system substrate-binding protein
MKMKRDLQAFTTAAAIVLVLSAPDPSFAQKQAGILNLPHFDSPASMSLLEESTVAVIRPIMPVFNNLVMFKQDVPQNSLRSIVPDLATSWSWNEEGTELTFPLRQGVKWHDGKPFTAADVKCTFDLLTGKAKEKLRINPRKPWYTNLEEVTTNGDYQATFHLKRPQPSFLALLASGWSPVYPCHVPPAEMRRHPIGTGPFKFVEFRPNQSITVNRNPDYWKPGRPYLDGIEYTIIKDLSTRTLAFVAGKGDLLYGVTTPQIKDIKSQAPQVICETTAANVSRNLLVNRDKPPFDNPDLRRAMSLSLDRKAFIDILYQGLGDVGGAMQPPPEGVWGLPPEVLSTLPGYDPDIQKNRAEARKIMEKLGYAPDKRLDIKVSTRDISYYRDPAVILIDQLKEIYFNGELEPVETTQWYPKVMRKDYTVGLNITETGVDDPDVLYYENYVCGAARNYTGYCNPQVDKLVDRQSMETDPAQRKKLVWEIEKRLVEDDARPILFYPRGTVCRQPQVKGLTIMVNSIYNGSRYEDLWLDR